MAKLSLQSLILLALLGIVFASGAEQSSSFVHLADQAEEGLDVFKVEFNPKNDNAKSIGQVLAKQKSQKFQDAESLVRNRRADGSDILTTTALINDSHNLAYIFYVGMNTNTILILTLTRRASTVISSYFYRSTDSGRTFVRSSFFNGKVTSSWVLNGVDRTKLILKDASNPNTIYTSSDAGKTFTQKNLHFLPSILRYSRVAARSGSIAGYDSSTKILWISKNNGIDWQQASKAVTRFSWAFPNVGDDSSRIYYEYTNSNNITSINYYATSGGAMGVLDSAMGPVVPGNLIVSNRYIFTLKAGTSLNSTVDFLYVSYQRGAFQAAQFPITLLKRGFLILETVDNEVVMAVNHQSNMTNLYISDQRGIYFSQTISRIFAADDFYWAIGFARVGFYRIASLPGSYMVNQVVGTVTPGFLPSMVTKITFNKGGSWHSIQAPTTDRFNRPTNCKLPACTLHINFISGVGVTNRGVYSSNAAPGLVLGFGSYGKVYSRANATLYTSTNGGFSWTQSSPTNNVFTALDHGSVILTVGRGTQRNKTYVNYSCDGGKSFQSVLIANQTMTVLTITTEPGSTSLRASVYGFYHINNFEWVIANLNFQPLLKRKCAANDYYNWIPSDQYGGSQCLLGARMTYQLKKAASCCFNGKNYTRPMTYQTCACTKEDFQCNYGFATLPNGTCQAIKMNSSQCTNTSKTFTAVVYRKTPGSVCTGGPQNIYLTQKTFSCTTLAAIGSNGLGAGAYVAIFASIAVVIVVIVGYVLFRHRIETQLSSFRRRKDEYLQEDLDHSVAEKV